MSLNTVKEFTPNRVDVYVGRKVNERRILLGLSMQNMADGLGITFQQVGKYLHGDNRISASRLHDIARMLHCKAGDFFPETDDPHVELPGDVSGFIASRLGVRTLRVLSTLRPEQLRSVLDIAHVVSEANAAAGSVLSQAAE